MSHQAYLEHSVAHPAGHERLGFSESLQIAIIKLRGETMNEIVVDVRFADMREQLQNPEAIAGYRGAMMADRAFTWNDERMCPEE